MEQGYVYVLVNSSYPGMAKVGKTTRPPGERAAELSGVTGVPTPFIVAYDQAFADCHEAERAIHAELDRRGLRVAPNREFFRGAPSDIIRLILEAADTNAAPASVSAPETVAALLAAGDRALFGTGDALQDTGEAVRCFKLAATRGSADALQRLGSIYLRLFADCPSRAARRRAMLPLKEGARRGNAYCFVEMAALFALEGHQDNVVKAWDLFFAGQTSTGTDRFAAACRRYIDACLHAGRAPAHLGDLRQAGDTLLAALLNELDQVRANPAARQRAVAALRWAYANVLAAPAPAASRPSPARAQRVWQPAGQVVAA